MKFSVLLPTRNRLEFLKYAVQSVLEQSYSDWEIIISDNDSEEDIKGYVASLNDERIIYCKTETFVPVTDNWNNALNHCSGDYVIMLGDDDALMNNYFEVMRGLLEAHHMPDMIFNEALMYAYPDVFPDHPNGFVNRWTNASFMVDKKAPFEISTEEAVEYAKETLRFKVAYNFNMQFTLFKRELVETLDEHGSFFQSPYPDYYATTALMLKAERILAVPSPFIIVGITKKSFGYYYFNELEEAGNEFLKNIPDKNVAVSIEQHLMPGTNMNTSWLFANETVSRNYGKEFNLEVDYGKYRFLQMLHVMKRYANRSESSFKEIITLIKSLRIKELLLTFPVMFLMALYYRMERDPAKRFAKIYRRTIHYSHPNYPITPVKGTFKTIDEVRKKVSIEEKYLALLPSQTALC